MGVKNIKWRDFEKKFVQKEMKKKFDGKDSTKWQKISCALAVFTKNKMGNDKSLGSAPWRSTRAVREKCNLLAAASKATASTSKKKRKKLLRLHQQNQRMHELSFQNQKEE